MLETLCNKDLFATNNLISNYRGKITCKIQSVRFSDRYVIATIYIQKPVKKLSFNCIPEKIAKKLGFFSSY